MTFNKHRNTEDHFINDSIPCLAYKVTARTSAIPDERQHTRRLLKLQDAVPSVVAGVFPTSTSARPSMVKTPAQPTYFGADFCSHNRRNRRYVDARSSHPTVMVSHTADA